MPSQAATLGKGLSERLEMIDGTLSRIQFFTDPGLQASLDHALSQTTANSVVVELEKNTTGWNAAVATRIGEQWSVVVGYTHDSWGHNGVGGKVKFEF